MIQIRIGIEKGLLLVFLGGMLLAGPGMLFGGRISHEYPYDYLASDSFQHQVRAEAIKDYGSFKLEAPYISKGFEGVEGRYPPILYHLAVVFSYAAGIEVYDSIYFIVMFFAIAASFVMYLIIRDFDGKIALLSLPLSMLVFSMPAATGILWGHWPSVLSQSFLVLFFWSIMRLDVKWSFAIIAVAMSAVFLTHTSEFVFGIMFLAIFIGIRVWGKKLSASDIKAVLLAFAVFLALSFYYMVIFLNTWAQAQPYEFSIDPVWEGNPGFYILGFGLLLLVMVIGMFFSLQKAKDPHVSMVLAFSMLLAGFMNYAGFQLRSFQVRFFWPIYLSVFFGFGLYVILRLFIKNWNFAHAAAAFSVFLILISGLINFPVLFQTENQAVPSIPQANLMANNGIMDSMHWESLEWLSENAEEGARVYFFYGDIYSQDALLRNSKRVHYQVDPQDFVNSLQEREVKEAYVSEMPGDTGGSIKVREGFFSFRDPRKNIPQESFFGPMSICSFDYHVFDKGSAQDVLARYNILIANSMLGNGASLAFENDLVVILKNNKVDGDCIEEGKF